MSIYNHFPESLSDDQKNALSKIEAFLNSPTNCFLLNGYAGTGKTFIMQGLVKYFRIIGRQFKLMAPTGRAAMVIGNRTQLDAYTIHKSIYNLDELEDDEHTFKFRYRLNNNSDSTNTIYIVDESSMISDCYNEDEFFVFGTGYLLKDLLSFIDLEYRTNAKIIFIGDNAQLPPVGMSFSPALDKEYLTQSYQITIDEFEMKQIQRQKDGSGILTIATALRTCLEKDEFNRFEIGNYNDTRSILSEEFDAFYFQTVSNRISEKTIVISHSNKQAHDYNLAIREKLFLNQTEVQAGDILINTKNNYNYPVDFYNGQFLKVIEASPITEPKSISFYKKGGEKIKVNFIFRDIIAELTDVKGQKHQVKCKLVNNFLKSDLPRLTQDEQQALYVDFKKRHPNLNPRTKEFKEAIKADRYFNAMQVKYGYAITCHKAQGGEWENVFVNFQVNMRILSRGFFRWAYTGITRSKKNLIAINAQNYSPLTEFIVQQTITLINAVPPNQYYVPNDFFERNVEFEFPQPFLKAKYVELTEKFKDQGIQIAISHLQWKERYTFTRDANNVSIDLNYGNRGFTGMNQIIHSNSHEFAQFVNQKITEPLIFEFEYTPEKEFQKELYDLLKEETTEEAILITNISNENYYDRYFLKTDARCAYLDCNYTGKGVYSIIRPYSTDGERDLKLQSLIKRLS